MRRILAATTGRVAAFYRLPVVDSTTRTIHLFRPAGVTMLLVSPFLFVLFVLAWGATP